MALNVTRVNPLFAIILLAVTVLPATNVTAKGVPEMTHKHYKSSADSLCGQHGGRVEGRECVIHNSPGGGLVAFHRLAREFQRIRFTGTPKSNAVWQSIAHVNQKFCIDSSVEWVVFHAFIHHQTGQVYHDLTDVYLQLLPRSWQNQMRNDLLSGRILRVSAHQFFQQFPIAEC